MATMITSPQLLLDDIVLEEICLDGLEGITIEGLWTRLAVRLKIKLPVHPVICDQVWCYILQQPDLHFYKLAAEREVLRVFDRRELQNPDSGVITEPDISSYTYFKYVPVNKNGEKGSCSTYDARTRIDTEDIKNLTLSEVQERYGRTFIIVGSQSLREYFLYPDNYDTDMDITLIQYCLLERIARSRYNGEKTIGAHSLLDMAKDSTLLFYQRSIIQKYNLVIKQVYIQKIAEHHTTGVLLQVPRYYHEYKQQLIFTTEKVVEYLKTKPKFMADYDDVKNLLNPKVDVLKNLVKTSDFQKVVLSDQKVLYRTLYPDASETEWKSKKYEEKHVRAMTLLDPNVDLSVIWYKEDEPEDISQHFINCQNDYFDKSLLRQAYDGIAAAKHDGISQTDLAKILGQHKLTTRTLVKNILKMNVISSYMTDEGRQRITKYILPKYTQRQEKYVQEIVELYNTQPVQAMDVKASTSEMVKLEQSALTNSQRFIEKHRAHPTAEPFNPVVTKTFLPAASSTAPPKINATKTSNTDYSEYAYHRIEADEISTEIIISNHLPGISKQPGGIAKAILRNTLPSRYIRRCSLIRNLVRERKIQDPLELQKEILATEKASGEQHQICKKSCSRLLDKLAVDNFIKIIQIYFRYKSKEKLKIFVCDTDIEKDDPRLLEAIRLQKVTIFCNSMERDKSGIRQYRDTGTVDGETKPLTKSGREPVGGSGSVQLFSMSPKFFKMKTLHEFMFCMIYDNKNIAPLSKSDVLAKWKTLHGSVDFQEISEEVGEIYCMDICWRTFVPPLPTHADYPEGWALLSDLVGRLPLSVFVNVNNLFKKMPNLNDFLDHPIKRHYLVRNLPAQLRNDLYFKRKYIFSVDEIVRHLCFAGLLQFGARRLVIKDQIYVYLNRRASFLDTTSSDPGYNTVTPAEYPVVSCVFNKFSNLNEYWGELQRVCTTTKLNKRDTAVGKEIVFHTLMTKPGLQVYLETKTPETAKQYDVGTIPGDHLGAGGLDSAFFSHLKKNWTKTKFKRNFDLNPNKHRFERINKKSIEYSRLKKDITKRYFKQASTTKVQKKIVVRRAIKRNRAIGVRVRKIQSRNLPQPLRKHMPMYDAIDKEALRLMNKLRVDWHQYEDNHLLLCRVAMKYLAPGSRKQYMTGHHVRDVLHWMNRNSMNKTSKACTRRIAYMLKTRPEINDSVNMCLEEVRTNVEVKEKYGENFVDNLKKNFKSSSGDFVIALKIHFVNLVFLLTKYYVKLASTRYETRSISLPDTMNAFKQNFLVKDSQYNHLAIKFSEPTTNDEIMEHTIMLMIHSSMCCSKDKTSWNMQLFDIYKNYPEPVLSNAMAVCRREHVISQNKTANRHRRSDRHIIMTFNEHFYHLSSTYINQLLTDLQYESIEKMNEKLKEFLVHNQNRIENWPSNSVEQTYLDCTAVNMGVTLVLGELLSGNILKFRIEVPDQIITLDPRSGLDKSGYEKMTDRFQEIYSYLQTGENYQGNVSTISDTTLTTKKKRFKFGDDEENVVFYLNPIENLMHFNQQYFHIFCLIANMSNSTMYSHLFQINENGHCSSENCLFENTSPDIMDTVLALIVRYRNTLAKVLSHKTSSRTERSYQLSEENLIQFFRTFIANFEASPQYRLYNKKDFGKLYTAFPAATNFPEVLKDVLDLSNNYDDDVTWFSRYYKSQKLVNGVGDDLAEVDGVGLKSDEMAMQRCDTDPSATIDDLTDKVRKLHDVFVVNSSKLMITAKDVTTRKADLENQQKFVKLDNLYVPTGLIKFDNKKREQILENMKSDFTWPKKDRNAEDLDRLMHNTDFRQNEKTKVFQIMEFIKSKEQLGATVHALKEKFQNVQLLLRLVSFLWQNKYLLRTGVERITYVHYKYVEPWTISTYHIYRLEKEKITASGKRPRSLEQHTSEPPEKQAKQSEPAQVADADPSTSDATRQSNRIKDKPAEQMDEPVPVERDMIVIRPAPWIRINGSLNRRVVDRWISAILLYLVTNPGVCLNKLNARFSFLIPVHIRYMLGVLEELGCIELRVLYGNKVDLFSSYSSSSTHKATEFDSAKETFVEVFPDAVAKLTLFIGTKLYRTDFIENI